MRFLFFFRFLITGGRRGIEGACQHDAPRGQGGHPEAQKTQDLGRRVAGPCCRSLLPGTQGEAGNAAPGHSLLPRDKCPLSDRVMSTPALGREDQDGGRKALGKAVWPEPLRERGRQAARRPSWSWENACVPAKSLQS